MNKNHFFKKTIIFLFHCCFFPFFLFVNPVTIRLRKSFVFYFWSFYETFFFKGEKKRIVARKGKIDFLGEKYMHFNGEISFGRQCKIECYDHYGADRFTPSLSISNGTSFGDNCHVGCINSIIIGKNVLIGSNVMIIDHNHGNMSNFFTSTPKLKLPLSSKGQIRIEDNCWIGENTIILPGSTIGKNTVVGASSVVIGNLQNNSVYAGNPAVKIR